MPVSVAITNLADVFRFHLVFEPIETGSAVALQLFLVAALMATPIISVAQIIVPLAIDVVMQVGLAVAIASGGFLGFGLSSMPVAVATTDEIVKRYGLNPIEQRVTGQAPGLRLIEDELWDRVQQRLAEAAAPKDAQTGVTRFWEKRRPGHLRSSKIFCGACGGNFAANGGSRYSCNNVPRGTCDHRPAVPRNFLEEHALTVLAENMMDPVFLEAFAETYAAERNRRAAEQGQVSANLQKQPDAAERKLENLLDAIAGGLRGAGLSAKLAAAKAETERLRMAIAQARPSPVGIMPNLGGAYRQTLARLRECLAAGDNPHALATTRELIRRITVHPTPKGTPPKITVEGHLAQMLAAAQPNLPISAANHIASAAEAMTVKEKQRGSAPQDPLRLSPSPSAR